MKRSWNDVTLAEYIQLENIWQSTWPDPILENAAILEALGVKNPLELTPQQFSLRIVGLKFLGEQIPEARLQEKYVVNGSTYIFNGNTYEMTTAQFMDYRAFSSKEKPQYEEILSVFLIPEGHKYNEGYDMLKVQNDILSFSIVDVLALARFFRAALFLSLKTSLSYFHKQLKKTDLKKESRNEIEKKIAELQRLADGMFSHTYFATAK